MTNNREITIRDSDPNFTVGNKRYCIGPISGQDRDHQSVGFSRGHVTRALITMPELAINVPFLVNTGGRTRQQKSVGVCHGQWPINSYSVMATIGDCIIPRTLLGRRRIRCPAKRSVPRISNPFHWWSEWLHAYIIHYRRMVKFPRAQAETLESDLVVNNRNLSSLKYLSLR